MNAVHSLGPHETGQKRNPHSVTKAIERFRCKGSVGSDQPAASVRWQARELHRCGPEQPEDLSREVLKRPCVFRGCGQTHRTQRRPEAVSIRQILHARVGPAHLRQQPWMGRGSLLIAHHEVAELE